MRITCNNTLAQKLLGPLSALLLSFNYWTPCVYHIHPII